MNIDFLENKGIALKGIVVNNYVFTKTDALNFIELLKNKEIVIFGGDVYTIENDTLRLSYDNWCIEKHDNESDENYLLRSFELSKTYVTDYSNSEALFAFILDEK